MEARRDVDYDWGTLQAIADTEKSESKQIDTSKIPPRRIPLLSGEGAVWLIADSQPDTAAYASNISSALREQKVLHLHESIVKVTRDRKFVMTDTGRTIRIKSLI